MQENLCSVFCIWNTALGAGISGHHIFGTVGYNVSAFVFTVSAKEVFSEQFQNLMRRAWFINETSM